MQPIGGFDGNISGVKPLPVVRRRISMAVFVNAKGDIRAAEHGSRSRQLSTRPSGEVLTAYWAAAEMAATCSTRLALSATKTWSELARPDHACL